jgi:hypothetical protein
LDSISFVIAGFLKLSAYLSKLNLKDVIWQEKADRVECDKRLFPSAQPQWWRVM